MLAAEPLTEKKASAQTAPTAEVDVEAMLTNLASRYSQPVNWKYSIVDLMAILGIDDSLPQRKALAQELGYTDDMNDSATMHICCTNRSCKSSKRMAAKLPRS